MSDSDDNTIHYAEFWENALSEIINSEGADEITSSLISTFNAAYGNSPFSDPVDIEVRDAFFSSGYVIESFPALWDMFGKFMAGVDVHNLWSQTFNDISTSAEINTAIEAQAAYLDDDIEANILPRFEGGMRNINAIQSSAFASGRAIIEDTRIKAVNKFASEIRIRALDLSGTMWQRHLDWNQNMIMTYMQMYKLYYSVELDIDKRDIEMNLRDVTFNLSLYEYIRAMMGVVSGAQGTVPSQEPSQTQKSISSTLSGATAGYSVGGGWGALAGGVLGLASSFL